MSTATALYPPSKTLDTRVVGEYRDIDKVAVFAGGAQYVLQHYGQDAAMMIPMGEYERLRTAAPKVKAPVTNTVVASDLNKRAGALLLGAKGGTQVVAIERYKTMVAVVMPYGLWVMMKQAAGERVPSPQA